LRQGIQLTIVDNLDDFYAPSKKLANLELVRQQGEFRFFQKDIRDYESMRRVFAAIQPDMVIHLAARAGVRPSIEQPLLYEQVNIGGTNVLLQLCREFGTTKFIFGSSSSVYGATSKAPFSEDHNELRPISPYAATKLSCELLAYTYARLFSLPVICLRFFTVYGPRQRPDLAIHKFTALLESGNPLPFFGDGSTGRDYTYVDDIVAGISSCLSYQPRDADGIPFDIFNLGNSHPVTLTQLVEHLQQATGRVATLHRQPIQPGDVPLTWADVSKAQRLLDFKPSVPLAEGLRRFISWYRESVDVPATQAAYA
jgi:UDP-glucuronate 4-epimerase